MTMNPPVVFNHDDHDPVKLIFCLAAVDNVAHLKIMSSLVKLINTEGKIDELYQQKDLSQFKKVLFNLEQD